MHTTPRTPTPWLSPVDVLTSSRRHNGVHPHRWGSVDRGLPLSTTTPMGPRLPLPIWVTNVEHSGDIGGEAMIDHRARWCAAFNLWRTL
jgi:hypothetical protein